MLAASVPAPRLPRCRLAFAGIFRRHMIVEDIGVRNSAHYSVIDDEWAGGS